MCGWMFGGWVVVIFIVLLLLVMLNLLVNIGMFFMYIGICVGSLIGRMLLIFRWVSLCRFMCLLVSMLDRVILVMLSCLCSIMF